MYQIQNSPSKSSCALCTRPGLYEAGPDLHKGFVAALHADWHQLVDVLEALPQTIDVDLEMMPKRIDMGPRPPLTEGCNY